MKKSLLVTIVAVSAALVAGSSRPAWAQPVVPADAKMRKSPASGETQEPPAGRRLGERPASKEPVELPESRSLTCQPLSITTPRQLPQATANTPYSEQIEASGGRAPISFGRPVGPLPPGLSLSSKGMLTGTPTAAGTHEFMVQANDSCQPAQSFQKKFSLPVALDLRGQSPELSVGNPLIESLFTVPLGALRPLSKLYVKGKHFGEQRGRILLHRESYSPVELIDVEWADGESVNGVVPESSKEWPNQTVTIQIESAEKRLGNLVKIGFGSREEKLLERDDIVVVSCGSDGNYNRCNHVRHGDGCGNTGDRIEARYQSGHFDDLLIYGTHCNNSGAVGDDVGRDRYLIHLGNGWLFKDAEIDLRHSSEAYVEGPVPSLPVGQSDWAFEFPWSATPADWLEYKVFRILVEGPIGTHYK